MADDEEDTSTTEESDLNDFLDSLDTENVDTSMFDNKNKRRDNSAYTKFMSDLDSIFGKDITEQQPTDEEEDQSGATAEQRKYLATRDQFRPKDLPPLATEITGQEKYFATRDQFRPDNIPSIEVPKTPGYSRLVRQAFAEKPLSYSSFTPKYSRETDIPKVTGIVQSYPSTRNSELLARRPEDVKTEMEYASRSSPKLSSKSEGERLRNVALGYYSKWMAGMAPGGGNDVIADIGDINPFPSIAVAQSNTIFTKKPSAGLIGAKMFGEKVK